LDDAFEALASLVEGRVLVPADSVEAQGLRPSLAAGEAVAGYEVEALVQALEDTEVYRALAPDSTRVALKVGRESTREALAHEARVLARLGGADTPGLLSAGEAHGRPFLAMEWRTGVSVAAAAQRARASGDRRALHGMVAALLAAYAWLHAKGVVHGDVHPGNVLVGEDGRVTLLDFGRACPAVAVGPNPTRAGIPLFYEPEMAAALLEGRAPPAPTACAEQYAVAALAYFLLTGLHPIEPSAEHQELLGRIVTRPPLPFVARGVPAWPAVEEVLRVPLAKDEGNRFADMGAFAAAFVGARIPRRPGPVPAAASALLDEALARVLAGWATDSGADALRLAALALHASLVRGDPDLLAAADLWARRAGNGWRAAAVQAEVARAGCDVAAEAEAFRAFMAAAEPDHGASTLLAAARLLDGAGLRDVDAAAPLAAWAAEGLLAIWKAGPPDPALLHAALALGRAQATVVPEDLRERLRLLPASDGDVRLWALAHDTFADPDYMRRARAAALRAKDGLSLLRLYQLTGAPPWLTRSRRYAYAAARRWAAAPVPGPAPPDTALLLLACEAPECPAAQ
jgi:serine/threonine-protein kinase